MYQIFRTSSFKKDYKKLSQKNKDLLKEVLIKLVNNETLEEKYKDHKLIGDYLGCKECHIKPDLLLIYRIENQTRTIIN